MELTSIVAAVNGIKSATDIARYIKDSGSSLEKAETKLKLADLISSLADIKTELANVQTLILEKNEIIQSLENRLSLKEKVSWEKPFYWLTESAKKDGPFCQCCYDRSNFFSRLQSSSVVAGVWNCTVCGNNFQERQFIETSGYANRDYDPFSNI